MHTFTSLFVHVVFSTENRLPFLTREIRASVHAYLGGCVRNLGASAIEIGGVADHVHLLAEYPPQLSISELAGKIKANSSRWIHETVGVPRFAWQRGYSAFSISRTDVSEVVRYIRGQEEHHRKESFIEEVQKFLAEYQINR